MSNQPDFGHRINHHSYNPRGANNTIEQFCGNITMHYKCRLLWTHHSNVRFTTSSNFLACFLEARNQNKEFRSPISLAHIQLAMRMSKFPIANDSLGINTWFADYSMRQTKVIKIGRQNLPFWLQSTYFFERRRELITHFFNPWSAAVTKQRVELEDDVFTS